VLPLMKSNAAEVSPVSARILLFSVVGLKATDDPEELKILLSCVSFVTVTLYGELVVSVSEIATVALIGTRIVVDVVL